MNNVEIQRAFHKWKDSYYLAQFQPEMTLREFKIVHTVLSALQNEIAPLPTAAPVSCCGNRLSSCRICGADVWKSMGDRDRGDWDEEVFECGNCQHRIHVELPG